MKGIFLLLTLISMQSWARVPNQAEIDLCLASIHDNRDHLEWLKDITFLSQGLDVDHCSVENVAKTTYLNGDISFRGTVSCKVIGRVLNVASLREDFRSWGFNTVGIVVKGNTTKINYNVKTHRCTQYSDIDFHEPKIEAKCKQDVLKKFADLRKSMEPGAHCKLIDPEVEEMVGLNDHRYSTHIKCNRTFVNHQQRDRVLANLTRHSYGFKLDRNSKKIRVGWKLKSSPCSFF